MQTPPGHWFVILNYVMDQPDFNRKFMGNGLELNTLDYDIIAYFMLGGAMHDVAVASWGVKGYYDYIRPVSAIRYMATKGQSSDEQLPNYHPAGIPLISNYIEQVQEGDPLAARRLHVDHLASGRVSRRADQHDAGLVNAELAVQGVFG